MEINLQQLKDFLISLLKKDEEGYVVANCITALDTFLDHKNLLLQLAEREQWPYFEKQYEHVSDRIIKPLSQLLSQSKKIFSSYKELKSMFIDIDTLVKVIDNCLKKLPKEEDKGKLLKDIETKQAQLLSILEKLTKEAKKIWERRTPLEIQVVNCTIIMKKGAVVLKQYTVEASSDFRAQRDHLEKTSVTNAILRTIVPAVHDRVLPKKPSKTHPIRHYGLSPNHLNSVSLGGAPRLVFYIHPNDDEGTIIRLCWYVSENEHNTAVSTKKKLRENKYWLIFNQQIDRTAFSEFSRIDPETLEDC